MSFEINRRLTATRPPLECTASVERVTADIIRGAFETICFETAIHLGRAASSAIINQSNERNASIIDGHGRLAAISVGIPQLLFISPLAVRWGLEFL
ncbi:MAG: hydantoinase B/oxoprolinase family protein, partial [Deltaproteobacteria bacterium]|nr:hydantoinase B/oxoprolinase family protein [Deltaproteobacteria bacterium]